MGLWEAKDTGSGLTGSVCSTLQRTASIGVEVRHWRESMTWRDDSQVMKECIYDACRCPSPHTAVPADPAGPIRCPYPHSGTHPRRHQGSHGRAAESARAREIYESGVAQGHSFDAIERSIAEALPELKNPLVPENVPYFTVRGVDFPNPEIAKQILQAFGEDRGDGVNRLYRFPVVFPSGAWQSVMPHELVAHTANERRYWSEYSADGLTRYCKCHAPVPVDASGRRTIRILGGRKITLRERNGGLCELESCPEYQERRCNLSGRFVFFIPGIRSISAFELGTNSFYAMNGAVQKFQTIAFMRGGRISGFLDAQGTPFYLSKKLVEVARIDEEGRAVRVAQWIIDLEAPIDVTALLRPDEDIDAIAMRAAEAVSVLEGQGAVHPANQAPEVFDMPPSVSVSDAVHAEGRTVAATARTAVKPPQDSAPAPVPHALHVRQGLPVNGDDIQAAVAMAEGRGSRRCATRPTPRSAGARDGSSISVGASAHSMNCAASTTMPKDSRPR
jgi:Recombination directionality factor-like